MAKRASICLCLIIALCNYANSSAIGKDDRAETQTTDAKPLQSFNARAKVISITDEGALCSVSLLDNFHKSRGRFDLEQPILICGVPAGLVDGDSWSGDIFYAGTFQYSAADNGLHTVRAFATDEQSALQRLGTQLALQASKSSESSSFSPDGKPYINPPFGLVWGEKSDQIKRLLLEGRAKIVNSRTIADQEIWAVEGLIQDGLKQTLFVFKQGGLTGIELTYQKPDWTAEKYANFFFQVQQRILSTFGNFIFVPTYTDDTLESDCVLWGYKWNEGPTAIAELQSWAPSPVGRNEAVLVRYQYLGN